MKSTLIILAIAIFFAACEGCEEAPKPLTELEKLPPATQQGKHTFGCLVDGQAWVTKTSIDARAFYQEGVLLITAFSESIGVDQGMSVYIYDENLSKREYHLSAHVNQFSNVANFGDNIANCAFETTTDYVGTVSITHLDQSFGKWIISGTFEFEAYSADCQGIVKVTDGRFDISYAP